VGHSAVLGEFSSIELKYRQLPPVPLMQSGYLLRNRYLIENRLSAGGFGETYIAIDKDYPDKRRVVVKHLKPQSNDPAVLDLARRLFATEAATLARLGEKTDLIPTLYAYFEEAREFYLVQELIEGQTLTQELFNRKLSEIQMLEVVLEILTGLVEVHSKQIIHRDLKPDNIIRREHDRKLVLIDFGAVKAVRQTTLNASNAKSIGIGTAGYMPTEQAMGYPNSASDIYAVGAIALQCLTGKLPRELFDEGDLEFKWQHLCSVSDRVVEILSKMVAARHLDRYPNAMEALQAIDPVLQSVRSNTHPPAPPYRPPVANSSPDPISGSTPKTAKTHTNAKSDRQKSIGWAALILLGFIGILGLLNSVISPKILPANNIATSQTPAADKEQNLALKDNSKDRESVTNKDEKVSQGADLEALAKYDRAIEINQKDADAYNERGILKQEKLNDTQGALADYNRAIQIDPNLAVAYNNRGNVKQGQLNDTQGALSDYNRAIKLNPDLALAYYNRGVLKKNKLNDNQGALYDYNRAIKINPKYAAAYYNRGLLKDDKLNDTQGALYDYNRAIDLNPQDADAYNNRGFLKYEKLNDTQGALADYDRAIQLKPDRALTYYNRGLLKNNKLNDTQGALADYNRAIEIDPKDADAYADRGVLKYSKLNDTQGALADYDRAIQLNPDLAGAYYNRGLLKDDKLNDTQGALADYNRAIQINPNLAVAYYNRGLLKDDKLKDTQGTLTDYNRAIHLNPDFADAYNNRSILKEERLNDRAGAIDDMKRAAKIYQQQGDTAKYQRSIEWLKQLK
jgi:tetratricopeptide (TPR) repeat protein